jgi:hypothetical protein
MSQFVNFSDEALRPVFILSALRNVCPETLSCRGDPVSEIRLPLVDDHEAIPRRVRSILTQYVGGEVCGEAVDGEDAVAKGKCLETNCRTYLNDSIGWRLRVGALMKEPE